MKKRVKKEGKEKTNEPSDKLYSWGRALVGLVFLITIIYLQVYLNYDFYKSLVGSFLMAVVAHSLYKSFVLKQDFF